MWEGNNVEGNNEMVRKKKGERVSKDGREIRIRNRARKERRKRKEG